MILLESTDRLEIVLGATAASSQATFLAVWADEGATPALGRSVGNTNNTTDVDMVAAPASGYERVIRSIHIYNADTAAITVTVKHFDGSTERVIREATIPAGQSLIYNGERWEQEDGTVDGIIVSGAAVGTQVNLTDGATITPDFSEGNNFEVTLGGNRTLGTPDNVSVGMSGRIIINQDGTGSRTLAYSSFWEFSGGTAPTATTTANATDVLFYEVYEAGKAACSFAPDMQ